MNPSSLDRRERVVRASAAILAFLLAPSCSSAGERSKPQPTEPTPATSQDAPETAQTSAGPARVEAYLESSHLFQGEPEVHAVVTLDASGARRPKQRAPVNFALVLDTSGSMAGEKINHARALAEKLVERLDETDRLAIVGYGSDVRLILPSTLLTDAAKKSARQEIAKIVEDGGTNLSGGLLAGQEQLLPHVAKMPSSRLVLVSDGMANEGIYLPEELVALARDAARQGISVTTVGLGLDYDEQTVTSMAIEGRGNYYFVESPADLEGAFLDAELATVSAAVATNVSLVIEPSEGVRVLAAYGHPLLTEGSSWRVAIQSLHADERRKIVLRLLASPQKPGRMELARVAVNLRPADGAPLESKKLTLSAVVTATRDQALAGRSVRAVQRIELARVGKTIEEATTLFERGQAESARELLEQRRAAATTTARAVKDDLLQDRIRESIDAAAANLAQPPNSPAGKRGLKENRKLAFELMR